MKRTHPYATATKNVQLENRLNSWMTELADQIAMLPIASQISAIYLGGGYGRGEGGTFADGTDFRLYNDLDFFVFTETHDAKIIREISSELKKLSSAWEKQIHVDVDFCTPRPIDTFPKVMQTLMYQELKFGHWLIYGQDVLEKIPLIKPEEIQQNEGLRLLLNRGTGILLAAIELNKENPNLNFIRRNYNKAILGIGDAMLIAKHLYAWTGTERLEKISHLQKMTFAASYQKAIAAKYEPHLLAGNLAELRDAWQELRSLWVSAVNEFLQENGGLGKICPGFSLRNAARWFVRIRRISVGRDPLISTFRHLQKIMTDKHFEMEKFSAENNAIATYLKMWKWFN